MMAKISVGNTVDTASSLWSRTVNQFLFVVVIVLSFFDDFRYEEMVLKCL